MCVRRYLLRATTGTSKYEPHDPIAPFKSLKMPVFLDHFSSTKSGVLRVSDNPHTLLKHQFQISRRVLEDPAGGGSTYSPAWESKPGQARPRTTTLGSQEDTGSKAKAKVTDNRLYDLTQPSHPFQFLPLRWKGNSQHIFVITSILFSWNHRAIQWLESANSEDKGENKIIKTKVL